MGGISTEFQLLCNAYRRLMIMFEIWRDYTLLLHLEKALKKRWDDGKEFSLRTYVYMVCKRRH